MKRQRRDEINSMSVISLGNNGNLEEATHIKKSQCTMFIYRDVKIILHQHEILNKNYNVSEFLKTTITNS